MADMELFEWVALAVFAWLVVAAITYQIRSRRLMGKAIEEAHTRIDGLQAQVDGIEKDVNDLESSI